MFRKIKEFLSIQRAKNARKFILIAIILFNVVFLIVASAIISGFHLSGTENMSFIEAAYCTMAMILDAGCIQFVIADIGQASVIAAIICLIIVLVGVIMFTGCFIGFITNYISNFIENANNGKKKLTIEEHTVILNWNARASEIINDLMYSPEREKIVVLAQSKKAEIEKEISERLADTVSRENDPKEKLKAKRKGKVFKKFRNRLTVIVREGDVFSSKQLYDISLEKAKTVIILGNDIKNSACKYEMQDLTAERALGNSQTIKTLMQVADITSSSSSRDKQQIVVEITDDWTESIVNKIIRLKANDIKCNIVPVNINKVHGQILSQFSLMPELNLVYKDLFSNKGASFHAVESAPMSDGEFVSDYLSNHTHAVPLTVMESCGKTYAYYAAAAKRNINRTGTVKRSGFKVDLRKNYQIEHKNVVILGHNSKCNDIMQGFKSFYGEWKVDKGEEVLRIIVIDDESNLEKVNYYKDYPFVIKTVKATIYDRDIICETIEEFVAGNTEDTSILILSDDAATNDNIDSNALANLVYVQDIINKHKEEDENFDIESIDVVVEIIDPKHHYIVTSYSVNNVVISNRYISKMITQVGQKQQLYDFFRDILTYDEEGSTTYESKEIYCKKVSRIFEKIPGRCTAAELIRAVYEASTDPSLPEDQRNHTVVLGYVKPLSDTVSNDEKMQLFEEDQNNTIVELSDKDKLIVYSTH